jgi:hypothetical protein
MSTTIFRWVGWFLLFFGIGLLFSPIIALLTWIPLVGWALGHVVSIAVWIFALVLSTTLAMLTISLAWLYYRPLYGLLFLALTGVGIAIIFLV